MKIKGFKKISPNRSFGGGLANFLLLLLASAFMVLPIVYAVCNAFKPLDELFVFPPKFYVSNPTLDNFRDVVTLMSQSWVPFSRYIYNTVFITLVGVIGHVLIASIAAYAFAKLEFFGKKLFFGLVMTALMFAGQVTAIANYLIMAKLNWIDTYFALIIPALAAPIGLFLMKQFMEQLPTALLEAGRIDGASEFRVFVQIAMPNVKPAWLTLIIFSFQDLWNMQGGTYIYSEQKKTLTFALSQIAAGGIARSGATAAVAVIMMIIPLTIFVISQSNVIETMSSSGIK